MARDRNGRDHKAAGRPDGGQYGEKAGQGSDDDLEVPTTAESVAPDEGWWASLEDDPEAAGPWWERKDRMTPELETMRRTVMEAHSRKEAADILDGLSELARCAVIRNLPFARKAAVADLAPDPDGQSDPATMAAGLPYTADDAKAGLLIGRAAKGDVRAAAALAFHGSDGDREWLAKSPMAEHPSVRAALKAISGDDDEPEKDGDRVKKTESGDKDGKDRDGKTAASKDDGTEPADPVAEALKELEGVGDAMRARAIIASRPRDVRVAVVRAQPFDRIAALADLTGDPDKARGYHSMLDMLPYTKDSPKDRLRDMASRGDVRAAAALAAYGDDDARRWLSTLPVGDHRAVQLALRAWTPPEARTTPKPPAASKPAPKPAGRAKGGAVASKPASKSEDKAEGKAMASKPAERNAGVRSFRSGWSTARHPARKPRKPPFRERMRGGLRQLRTIWSGVWTKWLAVFRR